MQSFVDLGEGYMTKYLKDKLTRLYGEQIIITNCKEVGEHRHFAR